MSRQGLKPHVLSIRIHGAAKQPAEKGTTLPCAYGKLPQRLKPIVHLLRLRHD
jgi:hypothetical protein